MIKEAVNAIYNKIYEELVIYHDLYSVTILYIDAYKNEVLQQLKQELQSSKIQYIEQNGMLACYLDPSQKAYAEKLYPPKDVEKYRDATRIEQEFLIEHILMQNN
ncbi:hypothetical protein ACIQ34_00615 [Ureibacillus sp. NPDC094379]